MKNIITIFVISAILVGCQQTNPGSAPTVSQPQTPIARTITNFSNAKMCMDQLLLESGRSNIPIAIDEVRDATSSVKVSTSDMIISALSDISAKSKAFRVYVNPQSLGRQETFVHTMTSTFADVQSLASHAPRVYIRGSISQVDNSIANDNNSVGVTLPNVSIGDSESQGLSTLTMDLQMADMIERTILPGTAISNTMTLVNTGDQMQGKGLLHNGSFGVGLSVSLSSNKREGKAQAVRTLIDFSVIELIGRYTGVPYWRCFQLDSTNPMQIQAAQAAYNGMSSKDQVIAVQKALWDVGEYNGEKNGRYTESFISSLTKAKTSRGLIPNGRVDFQIFNALVGEGYIDLNGFQDTNEEDFASVKEKKFSRVEDTDPLGLEVQLLNAYPKIGDHVYVKVQTRKSSRLYCYYEYVEDGQRVTARIFPNRYQSNNITSAHKSVTIPNPDGPVSLEVATPDAHKIACVATTVDYSASNTPVVLQYNDLEPIACDYEGVSCAVREHQLIDNLSTSVQVVTYKGQ